MEAWEEIKKSYSDDFEWIIGVTWLSHPLIILGTMMAYVVMAYAIKYVCHQFLVFTEPGF